VNHLHLHQLRLTPHNFKRLASRNYTFIHGEKVTVLESELAALRLVRHALENRIPLPVNYCSFPYKRRFQRAAGRSRGASLAAKGYEEATESGYLRTLAVNGPAPLITSLTDAFNSGNTSEELWEVEAGGEGLLFSTGLWPLVRGKADKISARYHEAGLIPVHSPSAGQRGITLPSGRRIAVARQQVAGPVPLAPDGVESILRGEEKGVPREILDFERIPSGLAEYF
jgi:hypothetical protein